MKNLRKAFAALGVAAILFSACQTKEDPFTGVIPNPNAKEFKNIKEFFEVMGEKNQSFSLNGATGGTLIGKNGTRFVFPPNAFVRPNGQIASGNISIEIKEITKVSQMILSNKPTVSNGRPLVSGGEFHISAKANGETLEIDPSVGYQVLIPYQQFVPNMQVFNGVPQQNGTVNWEVDFTTLSDSLPSDSLPNDSTYYPNDSIPNWIPNQGQEYVMNLDSLYWVNCDAFWGVCTDFFSVNVEIDNPIDNNNTVVFVHLTGQSSVLEFYYSGTGSIYTGYDLCEVPVTVVGLCAVNNALYSDFESATLAPNSTIILHLDPTTPADFAADLDALN